MMGPSSITITPESIEIMVGPSSITITPENVTIFSPAVVVSGVTTSITGEAVLEQTGAIIMLN